MNDGKKESSPISQKLRWEYEHINLPGHADVLIYGFSSSDLHDLRNIIKYALLQTFPMMLMDVETFG